MTDNNREINEAINNYYKLKNDYEADFYEKYVKPIVNSKKSTKEKKSIYQKLPKPKCINCKRNVSTLFSIKTADDLKNRTYSAKCGDVAAPCALNINILMPLVQPFDKILSENASSTGTINVIKKDIIKIKNDILFGYTNEQSAFDSVEKLTDQLKQELNTYDFYLETYISTIDNPVENNILKTKKVELGLYIQQFKDMINEFNQSNNQSVINSAVEFYINTMMPALKEIQDKTYAYNTIEYVDKQYILLQIKNTLEQLNIEYDTPKIVSYVVGTTTPGNINENPKQKPKPKSQSKPKLAPKLPILVREESTEEEIEAPEGSIDWGTDDTEETEEEPEEEVE